MPHSSKRFTKWFCCTVGDSFSFAWQQRQMLLAQVCDLPISSAFQRKQFYNLFFPWKITEAGTVSLTSFQRDNSFVFARNME